MDAADQHLSEDDVREHLFFYYRRLFPYRPLYEWLTYNNEKANYFQNREFSFTLSDVYMRYQSFRSQEEMQSEIQRLCPDKIDLGAVYMCMPCNPRIKPREAIERELTFDIDLSDYDEIRTCCQGGKICAKCWKLMAIACKVLHRALLEDYNFQHQLWVFSGRRGVHCWVCDAHARNLDEETRTSIAGYLQLLTFGIGFKNVRLGNKHMHTSVRRAKEIIEQQFVSVCVEGQDMLGNPSSVSKVFALFPDEARLSELKERMKVLTTSRERWDAIVKHIGDLQMRGALHPPYKYLLEEVMLQYAYPRLDMSVTTSLNHLLKAPFSIHNVTGKLCAPFDPTLVDQFDPAQVPTLSQLYDELNKLDRDGMSDGWNLPSAKSNLQDYMNTSMNTSILVFKAFLDKMRASCTS